MDKRKIYTFGYTLFNNRGKIDTEQMYHVLHEFGISYLADVRSIPFSKQYPHCNFNILKDNGNKHSLPYIHIPELGAKANPEQDVFSKAADIFFDDIFPIAANKRPEKTELSKNNEIVDFNKFRSDEYFLQGIKRVENAYDKNFTLALMCSEKEPLHCHRYFLVSRKLEQVFGEWLSVEHIIRNENGKITTITNKELDTLLQDTIFKREEVKRLRLQEVDVFSGTAKLDNYYGNDSQSKLKDFCDRYWNLMHGWKNTNNIKSNIYNDYD